MSESNLQKPRITVDTRHGILRINRAVTRALKDPDYVRLLIDRNAKEAALQQASATDRDKIEVPGKGKTFRFQINSKALTESLAALLGWEPNATYRIDGKETEGLVMFDLQRAVEIRAKVKRCND